MKNQVNIILQIFFYLLGFIEFNLNKFDIKNLINLNLFSSNLIDENLNFILSIFENSKSLKFLELPCNNFKEVDFVKIIISFENLIFLDLSHNFIETIDSKTKLHSNNQNNLINSKYFSAKIEFLDVSFNNLNNFEEILNLIKLTNHKLKHNNFLDYFISISIIANPFMYKINKFLSKNYVNQMNFIINKSAYERRIINIESCENSKDFFYIFFNSNKKLNIEYLDKFEIFLEEIENIIIENSEQKEEENNYNNLENKIIKKNYFKKNSYLNNEKNPQNFNEFNLPLFEGLTQFNIIYETYSVSKVYNNFNKKKIFIEKADKVNSKKVLILSNYKFLNIPLIKISQNSNKINSTSNNQITIDSKSSAINLCSSIDKINNFSNSKNERMKIYKSNKLNMIKFLDDIKILYLNHNKLSNLNNLEQFSELEELYLQNNKIKFLPNFQIKSLKKLDLSNNKISILKGILNFPNLNFLILENNYINELNTPEILLLNNLKEINLSGNLIFNLKECIDLRKIKSIVNFDLTGNEVSKFKEFRIYMIYYFQNLKILNKISVEKNEKQISKEYFEGKLTQEILEGRIGNINVKNISELDLSNEKLKDFENIFDNENFPCIKKLDLSKNLFSSFKIFGNLTTLKNLCLNSNLFSTFIDSKDKQLSIKGISAIIVNKNIFIHF